MRNDIAEQWAAALESGKYKQGRGQLAKDGAYCCLGVLCELAFEARIMDASGRALTKATRKTEDGGTLTMFDDRPGHVPAMVGRWAGMRDLRGSYGQSGDLTRDNDNDTDFKAIAKTSEGTPRTFNPDP